MLRRGVLDAVSIGSVTFVSVLSLKQWHTALEAEVKKVSKQLQKAARKGRPISYGDLLAKQLFLLASLVLLIQLKFVHIEVPFCLGEKVAHSV